MYHTILFLGIRNHAAFDTHHRAWQSGCSLNDSCGSTCGCCLVRTAKPTVGGDSPARTRTVPLPAASPESDTAQAGQLLSPWCGSPDNLMKELRCGNALWHFKDSDDLLCGNKSCQQVRTKPI